MLDPILREMNASKAPVGPPKIRIAYILLGIFLGGLGIHNFYAGYTGRGVAQLLTTLLTCGVGFVITWVWSLVEICIVTVDADGNEMT